MEMIESTVPNLGRTLKALRNRKGLSRQQLADKVGTHHNQIQKLENGERKLTVEWIARLAPILDTTPEQFLSASNQEPYQTVRKSEPSITQNDASTSMVPGYSRDVWPRDLRVLGWAECGPDGWSLWNGEVIEMTSRPPNLAGAASAYAVYVMGDSMEPRYHSGELVYVHPGRPIDIGCYVLVQVTPGDGGTTPRALLKRLVKRSGSKVVLEQFNPKKTIEIKAIDLISMHRIVGSGEA